MVVVGIRKTMVRLTIGDVGVFEGVRGTVGFFIVLGREPFACPYASLHGYSCGRGRLLGCKKPRYYTVSVNICGRLVAVRILVVAGLFYVSDAVDDAGVVIVLVDDAGVALALVLALALALALAIAPTLSNNHDVCLLRLPPVTHDLDRLYER